MDVLTNTGLTMAGLGLPPVTAITSGAAKTIASTNPINYSLKGKGYTKAALLGAAVPTTDAVTGNAFPALAASQGCAILLMLDSSQNIKAAQGPIVALDAGNAFILAPQLPPVPDGMCPFAYMLLKNGSTGSSFTFGTSNWNATGMTVVVQDIAGLPDRAQAS